MKYFKMNLTKVLYYKRNMYFFLKKIDLTITRTISNPELIIEDGILLTNFINFIK